jgi:Flp pilus assembly protein TadD
MARGYLLAFANPRTMTGSTEAFERSIVLDPKNAEAHHQYAAILLWLGRTEDADRELHLALALDPGRAISYSDLAQVHARDTTLAVTLIDSAVALDPTSPLMRSRRARARQFAGDLRGALDDAETANKLRPGNVVIENVLAIVLAQTGDTTRARTLVGHWVERPDHWLVFAAMVAVGDSEAALEQLEASPPIPGLWSDLHRWQFDALRGSPRFVRIMAALRPPGAVGP